MEGSAGQSFHVRQTQRKAKSRPVTWDAQLCVLLMRVNDFMRTVAATFSVASYCRLQHLCQEEDDDPGKPKGLGHVA